MAELAAKYPLPEPWKIEIGGLVNNPGTYDLDDLAKFQQKERIYRLRCVEGWSMVIPWFGLTLSQLLKQVEPLFRHFRKEHRITHFYFHSPDRVCILRMHKPDRYGDKINRFTALEAEKTGKTSWGIELGPLGTFTLETGQAI